MTRTIWCLLMKSGTCGSFMFAFVVDHKPSYHYDFTKVFIPIITIKQLSNHFREYSL